VHLSSSQSSHEWGEVPGDQLRKQVSTL
jgi:hypothetical protein